MTFLLFLTVLYFLPTLIGHNKRDVLGIFIVNLLFGWTFIGWIIAMVWACSAEPQPRVLMVAGPAPLHYYCCGCGSIMAPGARFCMHCGRAV
jgi:Superinfection immunity protein